MSAVIDARAIRKITTEWIQKQMKERVSEFSSPTPLTVFCGTWNVNNKVLLDTQPDLSSWLFHGQAANADVDMYCLGFQEIVELNAVNVAIDGSKSQQKSTYWQEKISETLATKSGVTYTLLTAKHMVGVLLCVYVKSSLAPTVRDVNVETAAVGALGMMANKCGVSVSLRLRDTTVCVVCAHLAAKRDNVLGRNADFHDILQKTVFPSPNVDDTAGGGAGSFSGSMGILDHDIVVWIGDLNYRIDEEISTEEVFEKVKENDLQYLLEKDQLLIERDRGTVFRGFEEGSIQFPPTYKFQQGTDEYEHRKEKKLRAPAWCDRILWRCTSGDPTDVQLREYSSSPLNPSDHKPVLALLTLRVRDVDVEKAAGVRRELVRELDKLENGTAPQVSLSWSTKPSGVHKSPLPTTPDTEPNTGGTADSEEGPETDAGPFQSLETEGGGLSSADVGPILFQERREVVVRLANNGRAPAKFFLVPRAREEDAEGDGKGMGAGAGSEWLSVHPTMGLVLPYSVFEIVVTVCAGHHTAQRCILLQQQQPEQVERLGGHLLEDVLIIRIDRGRDFFIPVTAQLLPVDVAVFDSSLPQDTEDPPEGEEGSSAVPVSRTRTLSTGVPLALPFPFPRRPSISEGPPPVPTPSPAKFVSPLDEVPESQTEEDRQGSSSKSLGSALAAMREKATVSLGNTREVLDKARENTREALDRAREKEREIRTTAAEKLRPVADKATAGWQSFTSAVSKIIPPPASSGAAAGSMPSGPPPPIPVATPSSHPSLATPTAGTGGPLPSTVPANACDDFDAGDNDDDSVAEEAHV